MRRRLLPSLILLLTAFSLQVRATTVEWSNNVGENNRTSTGAAWDSGWVFELGSFANNFVPTTGNMSQWAANWRVASRSPYNTALSYFAGTHNYSQNTSPFLTTNKAYIWGHDGRPGSAQWFLATRSSWLWPQGSSGVGGLPTVWIMDGTATFIVGSGSAAGLASAAVDSQPLRPFSFADWAALYFDQPGELTTPAISGPSADPDGDGISNLHEYASGSHPRDSSSRRPIQTVPFLTDISGQKYFSTRLDLSPRAQLTVTLHRSLNLQTWDSSGSGYASLSAPSGSFAAREAVPVNAGARVFHRWLIAIP